MPQLEPRSFSFNSPYGACPACHGLGSKYDFDPAKVIVDWTRPLFDGGLGPGARAPRILKRTLELGAYAHGFTWTPRSISIRRASRICCCTDIHQRTEEAAAKRCEAGESEGFRFQGVLKFLETNFEQSGSDTYREWMTQYMSATLCSACLGSGYARNSWRSNSVAVPLRISPPCRSAMRVQP